MSDAELRQGYFETLLGDPKGRRVLANIRGNIYGLEVSDSFSASWKASQIALFETILEHCGVTGETMIEALALCVANQVTKEPKEDDMYNEGDT